MKNQSLMEGEEGSASEDALREGNELDGPPAKRARTDRVTLDSEETAFASSLPPLRRTPGAMSQNKNEDSGSESSESSDREGDGMEGEYDQEGVGFQDNGVCSQFLNELTETYYSFLDVSV